jgi:putative transposase
MPDHVHLMLTPAPEVSLEKSMQYIKGGFSFHLKSRLDVWQRSFTNHRIANTHDYLTHTNYIHQNPIDAGLATEPDLYPHSSANPLHLLDPMPPHFNLD